MINKLFIDGIDAYAQYSIFIEEGGYDALLAFPPSKKVASNDWAEYDGEEVDLSSPALDTHEFIIKFIAHSKPRFAAFIELLSNKAYHTFDFREIGRVCKLRLVGQTNYDINGKLEFFSLTFAKDFPLQDYSYLAPQSTIAPRVEYKLDGRNLSDYGVNLLDGANAETLKSPAVKKNLIQNFERQHGAIYDGERVKFQAKDITLNYLMRAATLQEFWRNHNALLYDLVRVNERKLYVQNTNAEYPCYYKSCSSNQFFPTGKIWWRFSLTLTFTSFRVKL